jgi:uncharacterized protein GlcG (DUF336 family)
MRVGWLSLALVLVPVLAMAQLPTRKYLPLGLAVEAALGAIEKCDGIGQYVAAAVVEPSGQALALLRHERAKLQSLLRHERAKLQSLETARNWAQQGALRMPVAAPPVPSRPPALPDTNLDEAKRKAMDDARRVLEDQRRRTELAQRRTVGLPIEVQDFAVAQIAVAGATEPDADLVCAKAGIDRIRSQLR